MLSKTAKEIKKAFIGNMLSKGLGGAALGATIGAFQNPTPENDRMSNIMRGAGWGGGIGAGVGALSGISKALKPSGAGELASTARKIRNPFEVASDFFRNKGRMSAEEMGKSVGVNI